MYPLLVCNSIEKWTLINFIIYSVSLLIAIFCFISIHSSRASAWSLFGICYFLSLWLNSLQLSEFQVEKTVFDLYIMISGPLVFLLMLMFIEKIKVVPFQTQFKFFELNFLYIGFIFSYIILSLYIHSLVGWRLDAIQEHNKIISGDEFVVPVFSGLWAVISWIMVILAPHAKKRYAAIAIFLIIVFSGILHVKRGDIIRILLFFIVYLLATKQDFFQQAKGKRSLIIALIIMSVVLFVLFGQWRLAQSGNNAQTIIDITGVRIESAYVAWIFGYIIVQFDVFSLSTSALVSFPYSMNDLQILFSPISTALALDDPLIPINGFNAGTAFWSFYRDYGSLFFIEMFVFWLVISSLLLLSKKTNCKGAYCFTCLLCALMVFGNYFSNRSMIIAIILSNITYYVSQRGIKSIHNDGQLHIY
jgi:hypothetical protein